MSILRATLQPVLGPVLAPVGEWVRDGDPLTRAVLAMFANAEKGVMFDLSRASGLYQDSARTMPVTATNQGIGSVTDLSPNGKHAASAGNSRPLWNSAGYGSFDGFDDFMQTSAIDFTGTDAVTVVVSLRKTSDAAVGVVVGLGPNGPSGNFNIKAPRASGARNSFNSAGTINAEAIGSLNFAAPVNMVMTGRADISADTASLRINGASDASSSGDQGTGNYRSDALRLGEASSQFFTGRMYRLLVIGRALTPTELSAAEQWAAQPAGVTMP